MTNQENPASHCKAEVKRKLGERLQPEEAYLTIPVSLRAAMKKHLPWVNFANLLSGCIGLYQSQLIQLCARNYLPIHKVNYFC